ncbi:probable WRKY transcription factor 29 isoform X2 [Quercus suber]|uniref:Wrky transcription factor 29 n=1 Tax=Quercus suber TaxID=58331 RepID=A0AAW0KKN6_QUESU
MSDFACMEDWGLQAVVRGYINEAPTTTLANPKSCFAPLSGVEDDPFSFPEISETATVLDELEKLYNPVLHPLSSQTMPVSSISVPKEAKEPEKQPSSKEKATAYKKRKNQHKRVVQHVTAEGLCSDMWAWRKYGQKPIKGSPYPRSYYRCSSSKGCPARKQVERSHLDPEVFIINYSSEHNHSHPTRRNSLAGSTRSKFPTSKKKGKSSTSPTTPLMSSSIENEFVQSTSIKIEELQQTTVQDNEGNDIVIPDLDKELFPCVEDFDELAEEPALDVCFLDQLLEICPPWFIDNSISTTTSHGC